MGMTGSVLCSAALLIVVSGRSLCAQEGDRSPPAGTVSGSVIDAQSGDPIADAAVTIDALSEGRVMVRPTGSGFWGTGRVAATDANGNYGFEGIPPGLYRVSVRRLGYRPAAIEIDLQRARGLRLSVGLVVVPIRLEPVAVEARRESYGRMAEPSGTVDRIDAERVRQDLFVAGDARALTHGEVVEAVTLGETDLFRAVRRLPGVSTRDDYTAEVWTRGASWGMTRVYFDGLPLFNPLHTIGVFSAIDPDAVGGVYFLPGVRPPSLGEGAAGVLDITSRPAGGERWRGLAELSVVSARAAVDRRFADGRGGLMLAGRRSYVDVATRLAEQFGADSGTYIPYAFHDVTGRVDVPLGRGAQLELSGLWEQDRVWGTVRNLLRNAKGGWGNSVGRVSLTLPIGGVVTRHTVGVSRFLGRIGFEPGGGYSADTAPTHSRMHNGLTYVAVGSEVESGTSIPRGTWRAGVHFIEYRQSYDGPYPRPYPSAQVFDSLRIAEIDRRLAVWGDGRLPIGGGVVLQAGARVEVGRAVANAPVVALGPRVSARYTLADGRVALSAGYGRSFQYAQPIAPAGPGVGPDLHLTDVWLLAGDSIPAIRSDVGTIGAELLLGEGWRGGLHFYTRTVLGVSVPSPFPGIYSETRPVFVEAVNRARGAEASVRRITGRWTGSLAYSYAISNLEVGATVYPAPSERRHQLDATMLVRATPGLRVGAALTVGSGAPYTRFVLRSVSCDSLTACPPQADTLQIGDPSAERAPTFGAFDLLAEWRRPMGSLELRVRLQLHNAWRREQAVTYVGSIPQCDGPASSTTVPVEGGVCDLFDRGLPFLPLVGVSVAF